MEDNKESQIVKPSLDDILLGKEKDPFQVSYSRLNSIQTIVLEERNLYNSQLSQKESLSDIRNIADSINSTVYKELPSSQTNDIKFSKIASIEGKANMGNNTTSTTLRGRPNSNGNINTNSQVYSDNQKKSILPTKMGISQNLKGDKYQIRKVDQSNKQKKKESDHPSIRKKTINRGNSVENVQITHIILTSRPVNFHITEKLNLDNLKSAPIRISKTDRARLQKKGKITYSSSCDNIRNFNPKIINLKGNTTHYQHARGMGMTNDKKQNINPKIYAFEIKKLEPIKKQKNKEKIENIENFRSKGKVNVNSFNQKPNNNSKNKNSKNRTTNTTVNRGEMGSSLSGRSGNISFNVYNRGRMTNNNYNRGNNMGDSSNKKIIKETNTKASIGNRNKSNKS